MTEARKQKRIDVLGIIRPRDKPTYNDVFLLVTRRRRQIKKDPDVDPARRQFLGIELGTVDREHEDDVILSDAAILKCLYYIRSMENVCILV
jgi:hypothetical protein